MKKTILLGTLLLAGIVSAFPFRTTCGMVFQINENYAKNATPQALDHTLKQLNYSACGTIPASIVYYTSSVN